MRSAAARPITWPGLPAYVDSKLTGRNKFTGWNKFMGWIKFMEWNKSTGLIKFTGRNKFSGWNKFTGWIKFTGWNKSTVWMKFTGRNKFSGWIKFTGRNQFSGWIKFTRWIKSTGRNKFSGRNSFRVLQVYGKVKFGRGNNRLHLRKSKPLEINQLHTYISKNKSVAARVQKSCSVKAADPSQSTFSTLPYIHPSPLLSIERRTMGEISPTLPVLCLLDGRKQSDARSAGSIQRTSRRQVVDKS